VPPRPVAGAGGVRPQALGQLVQDVASPVVPAALVAGRRVHLAQGGPQPEAAVADRQERRGETALAQVAQDVGPGVGALAIAEAHAEQFLVPIRTRADDHEQAARLGFESGAEVDPVRPDVGEGALDRAAPERAVVGFPVDLEAQDRRAGEGGLLTEELSERRLEVARGEAFEVQPQRTAAGCPG
jgi:hypothetical protein